MNNIIIYYYRVLSISKINNNKVLIKIYCYVIQFAIY